jgi:hypothetical protein
VKLKQKSPHTQQCTNSSGRLCRIRTRCSQTKVWMASQAPMLLSTRQRFSQHLYVTNNNPHTRASHTRPAQHTLAPQSNVMSPTFKLPSLFDRIRLSTVMTGEISAKSEGLMQELVMRASTQCNTRSVRLAEYPGVQAKTMDEDKEFEQVNVQNSTTFGLRSDHFQPSSLTLT